MGIRFDRFATLGQYVKALPTESLKLNAVLSTREHCGTVACALSFATLAFPTWWSGTHLVDTGAEGYVVWHLPDRETADYTAAAAHAFGISAKEAMLLFAPSGMSAYNGTFAALPADQQLFLYRLDYFLAPHGQPLAL